MEEPRLKPDQGEQPGKAPRMSRLGIVLVNLPWLMLLVLWWLWPKS